MPPALLPSAAPSQLTTATLNTGLLLLLIDGLIAPFVEELYYRGYLLPRLSRLVWRPRAQLPAVYAGAFLAALQLPAHFPAGVAGGLPRLWKRNIKLSIILHCTSNTFAAMLSLVLLLLVR